MAKRAQDRPAPPPGITIIVPAYNEEESILPLYQGILKGLKGTGSDFEIIFVDDGSTDGTRKRMKSIVERDPRVRIVTFWRNFGKANALAAGFKQAKGRMIVQMDADLQDDPKEIPRFLKKLDSGYDMVVGWKRRRRDPYGKTLPSKLFNHLIRRMSKIDVHDSNCGFKAYRREVMEHLSVYGEMHRYLPTIARWRGFRVTEIVVHHHPRRFGSSKYGLERLAKGFLDLMTIAFLTKYGRSPMHFFGKMSVIPFLLFALQAIYIIGDWALTGHPPERPMAVTAIVVLLWGFTIISFGLISEMVLMTVGPDRMVDSFSMVIGNEKR